MEESEINTLETLAVVTSSATLCSDLDFFAAAAAAAAAAADDDDDGDGDDLSCYFLFVFFPVLMMT